MLCCANLAMCGTQVSSICCSTVHTSKQASGFSQKPRPHHCSQPWQVLPGSKSKTTSRPDRRRRYRGGLLEASKPHIAIERTPDLFDHRHQAPAAFWDLLWCLTPHGFALLGAVILFCVLQAEHKVSLIQLCSPHDDRVAEELDSRRSTYRSLFVAVPIKTSTGACLQKRLPVLGCHIRLRFIVGLVTFILDIGK